MLKVTLVNFLLYFLLTKWPKVYYTVTVDNEEVAKKQKKEVNIMEDYKKEKRDIEDFINGTVKKLSPANKEKAVYIMQGMIIGQLASEQAEISKNMIDAVNQFNEVRL